MSKNISDGARALAAINKIDLTTVQGSGPGGRIVKTDIEKAIKKTAPKAEPVK